MEIEPLLYGELINPQGYVQILGPNEIPVHPSVYASPLVYTPQFVKTVVAAVPDSIKRDIETIDRVIHSNYNFEIDEEGLNEGSSHKILFTDFTATCNPQRRQVEVEYVSSNIAGGSPPGGYKPYRFSPRPHPIPMDKLIAYGFDPDDDESTIYTWYTHNILSFGNRVFMYFRNFAIMFNNLGLQELAK